MNDSIAPGQPAALPRAEVRTQRARPFNAVWLIPIVAALVAGWLVWSSLSKRGPEIIITFRSGEGITAGQTKVKHKAVDLGTVTAVSLSSDLNSVEVRVDMLAQADRMLTDSARFWVVRPRLTPGNVSGLDTVLSGSYVEMDPGPVSGPRQTRYTGLEDPPAVRSGEPGTTFVLKADRIGSLGSGSPIFYRDVAAGEVLGYELGQGGNGVTIRAFIRAPFDQYVRPTTHFWNASGISIDLGAQGLQVRLASLQALVSGGIAFDAADDTTAGRRSEANATFKLYSDEPAARAAGYSTQIRLLVYFDGSVRGLGVGAPVEINGIQIGRVTGVQLLFDPDGATSRVAVHMEVQPERFLPRDKVKTGSDLRIAQGLVDRGMRAQLASSSLLTGQMLVAFEFVPNAAPEHARQEGDEIVLPAGAGGGLDGITSNLARITQKLDSLPLDQVVRNLNETLRGASQLLNGPELRQTLANLETATKRLPGVAQRLDSTLARADHLVGSAETGYGADSQVNRDIARVLSQINDTARSVRLLADYLALHPEALLRGRTGRATEQ